MKMETVKIYIVAGEASGDALGGKLMAALKNELGDTISFHGVGGERMKEQGLNSFFPMEELSLLGFAEILPHIPKLLKRIKATAKDIIKTQPDIVITIDAPAFNKRVIRQLRKLSGKQFTCVHYVAPTVWAYKPKRAKIMAELFDHLLVLLPFEPPYFEKEGLDTTFIGHPIVENFQGAGEADAFRKKYNISPNTKLLGIMPGSRSKELKRHLPILKEAVEKVQQTVPDLHVVLFATDRFQTTLSAYAEYLNISSTVVTESEKQDAVAACDAALVKSGTGTLDFALQKTPISVFYKVSPLSAFMLRRMIKIDYVNLINIIHNAAVIPERLQEECTPDILAKDAITLLTDTQDFTEQLAKANQALEKMGFGDKTLPSQKAANTIKELLT